MDKIDFLKNLLGVAYTDDIGAKILPHLKDSCITEEMRAREKEKNENSFRHIIDTISANTGYTYEQLKCRSRKWIICYYRAVAWLLLKERTTMSECEIAKRFERDHATINLTCKRAKDWLIYDQKFRSRYERIKNLL